MLDTCLIVIFSDLHISSNTFEINKRELTRIPRIIKQVTIFENLDSRTYFYCLFFFFKLTSPLNSH